MPRSRLLILSAILVVLAGASDAKADSIKPPRYKRGLSTETRAPFSSLADVAEAEPNGSASLAQSLECGNSLRPATLTNIGDQRDQDWISFDTNEGDLITFETTGDPEGTPETDTVISLISSDGSTVLISNDDTPGVNTFYSRIADFQAPYTGLYYGRIIGFNGAQGSYRANLSCASAPPPPVNDVCAGAITIPRGFINLSGTTLSAHDDYDLCPKTPVCPTSCTQFSSAGRDVVYRLDAASAGDRLEADYNLTPATVDASIYVLTDCGNIAGSCIAGQDTDLGSPQEHLSVTFPHAGTYYLVLDAFNPGGASWTLTGCFQCVTPTASMSWGRVKSIYR